MLDKDGVLEGLGAPSCHLVGQLQWVRRKDELSSPFVLTCLLSCSFSLPFVLVVFALYA